MDEDEMLAVQLQAEFLAELDNGRYEVNDEISSLLPNSSQITPSKGSSGKPTSIVAPEWEDLDPTPDLHSLFIQYNDEFFWGRLSGCEVKWSPRMTLCAGVCSYQRRSGYCSIRLSVPLLKLRPRKDLVETLLHEMIHAYLFVTDGNDDHDGHGPAFHEHMFRINKATGTKISVYHNFRDEVENYRQHWWQCSGPCRTRKPFFGLVKRAMNRAPGPNDTWWRSHQESCGGTYTKIKEPENYGKKNKNVKKDSKSLAKGQKDIRSFVASGSKASPSKAPITLENSVIVESSSSDVRARLRDVWNAKFPAGNESKNPVVSGAKKPGLSTGNRSGNPGEKRKISGDEMTSSNSSGILTEQPKIPRTIADGPVETGMSGKSDASGPLRGESGFSGHQNCPVCGKNVASAVINSHLDKCLETAPDAGVEKLSCPVCDREIYSEQMNEHLDNCVT